ncbi:MAG: DUF6728 family protein [Bacteroidota bacterium]
MEVWKKIVGYITFKKRDPEEPTNTNLKVMHGINKVSIIMFLIGVVVLVIKLMK